MFNQQKMQQKMKKQYIKPLVEVSELVEAEQLMSCSFEISRNNAASTNHIMEADANKDNVWDMW